MEKKEEQIKTCRFESPVGEMIAGADDRGIRFLEFLAESPEGQLHRLERKMNASLVPGENIHLGSLIQQMREYFESGRRTFDIPLVFFGTEFQKKVWNLLIEIPYGETRSYQFQAQTIGEEKAIRAVASANGDNPISILIPCHRVIGKNGSLTGYAGGLWRKKFLLELEEQNKSGASQGFLF